MWLHISNVKDPNLHSLSGEKEEGALRNLLQVHLHRYLVHSVHFVFKSVTYIQGIYSCISEQVLIQVSDNFFFYFEI